MLISCKYEEIYAPEVKDFVYVTDTAYSKEEVLDMEGRFENFSLFRKNIKCITIQYYNSI
jgi:hypothetical protein